MEAMPGSVVPLAMFTHTGREVSMSIERMNAAKQSIWHRCSIFDMKRTQINIHRMDKIHVDVTGTKAHW